MGEWPTSINYVTVMFTPTLKVSQDLRELRLGKDHRGVESYLFISEMRIGEPLRKTKYHNLIITKHQNTHT